jgi:hypothetical protein
MTLSNKTIKSLALAITPEVIDYIYSDDRWIDFMIELAGDAISEKLGTSDNDLIVQIGQIVIENIELKPSITV